jgi:predicted Zn-dependent protease
VTIARHLVVEAVDMDGPDAAALIEDGRLSPAANADEVVRAAHAVLAAGRLDEAETILAAGALRHPGAAQIVVEQARLADRRGAGAADAWARVREVVWDQPLGFVGGARAARDAGRMAEAAALLATARTRFPEDDEPLIESGWLAQVMRDWPAAAQRWEQVRQRAPHHIVGFINGAVAVREMGDLDAAEALIEEAKRRFAHEAAPWIESATLAQHRRNWAAAAARWDDVRERFADVPASWSGAALALREQNRFAEADALLTEAVARFPDNAGLRAERCWIAHVARDWPEAAQRWADLRHAAPDLSVGWTSGAVALRELGRMGEAEVLLGEAVARFPGERSAWTERAWLAWARRDWPESARRWADVRARFPDFAEGYLRGGLALAEAWDMAGAEALFGEALQRFPDDSAVALEYAGLAQRQNRPDEAEARFAHVRETFPHEAEGHLGAARALRNRFRLDEAGAALEAAQHILPDEPRLWLEHALLPVFAPLRRDRDPEEALRRLGAMRARFPDNVDAILAQIRQLREEERLEEAANLADEAAARLPDDAKLALECAALALARRDWEAASQRYSVACARFPHEPAGFIGAAQAMAATGRAAEAEAALREAIARFPGAAAAHTAYAEMAMQRQDWPEALARWTAARARFPDDNSFAQRIFDVQLNMVGETADEETAATDAPAAADGADLGGDSGAELRELVMRFESLGGRELGCEFGMFQREFGAEPLGLLRWADMPLDGLLKALESRFEGVGLPENTEVFVSREHARGEYCTRDLRGYMFMRAFVYEDEMPMERMQKQALRRLVYLKDKLIEDLETGSKIFVWRCTERDIDDAELARLHAAMRAYGDNTLFYVRRADAVHPNGTVELVKPGLMVGYIDRFKISPEGVLSSAPPSASWLALCRAAVAVVGKH